MPKASSLLTREQMSLLFDDIETKIPILHYHLRSTASLKPSEDNLLFNFYTKMKSLRERVEAKP